MAQQPTAQQPTAQQSNAQQWNPPPLVRDLKSPLCPEQNVASATECTGLEFCPVVDGIAAESYTDLYAIHQQKTQGNIGKDNKMFLLPMAFMLFVTIASLGINTKTQLAAIAKGGADWGPYVQAILGVLLIILAIVLAIEGVMTIAKQKKAAKV